MRARLSRQLETNKFRSDGRSGEGQLRIGVVIHS